MMKAMVRTRVNRNARIARHVAIGPDRHDVPAIARAVEHEGGDQRHDENADDRDRQAQERAEIDRAVDVLDLR